MAAARCWRLPAYGNARYEEGVHTVVETPTYLAERDALRALAAE